MENLSGRILLKEFHGGQFSDPFQHASNSLHFFRYESLDADKCLSLEVNEQMYIVLIPITGDLIYQDQKITQQIGVGQVFLTCSSSKLAFDVKNQYKDQTINFIHFQFKSKDLAAQTISLVDFELINNSLIDITPVAQPLFRLHIGRFSGRTEITYHTSNDRAFFCFALAGAFEVQGRLIHPEDALALWNNETIELEALSNDAVIMAIDFPYICL